MSVAPTAPGGRSVATCTCRSSTPCCSAFRAWSLSTICASRFATWRRELPSRRLRRVLSCRRMDSSARTYTMSPSRDAVATPPIGVPALPLGAVTGVITVSVDGNVVQVVSLTGKVLTIGRLPDNGLVLSHATISRRHAEIRLDGAYAILTDLGSSTGTRVADHRLKPNEPVALESGDTAQIGPYT